MRVLIVKLSSLGDVIHTLPVVQDMRRQHPGIVIDWVVENAFADLVTHAAGMGKVIRCELRRWVRRPFSAQTRRDWSAFLADLRAERYDAVLDLQGLSKSAVVARFAKLTPGGKRYAMANRTEGSSYEPVTRWVADVALTLEPHVHAVTRSRLVCAQAQHYSIPTALDYGLQVWRADGPRTNEVMLVTASSRERKSWPVSLWVELVQKLSEQGLTSVLVHGSDDEQQRCQMIKDQSGSVALATVAPRMKLDRLAEWMGQCCGVIGVDSGLSHLAVALNLPHVQLYNFKTAWRTGPLPTAHQISVEGHPHPSFDQVWGAWRSVQTARP